MIHEPGALIRELRPDDGAFDPDSPAARASLERILEAPPLRRPPRRRGVGSFRPVAFVAATALLAGLALALTPFLRGSPDVIARAAAALADPGTILHFRAEIRARESAAERRGGRPDGRVDSRVESWQGRGSARSVFDGGKQEIVLDTATGRGEEYFADMDLIAPIDPSGMVPSGAAATESPGLGASQLSSGVVGDLARLLERARAGDDKVRVVGETTVRGIPAYELRLDFTIPVLDGPPPGPDGDPRDMKTRPMRLSRLIYVDREHYLPLRVVERGPQDEIWVVTDYVEVERLPVTAATARELRMSPHAGAQRADAQGRFTIPDERLRKAR